MAVAFDTDVLSLLFDPDIPPPQDPTTGKPVTHVRERLDYLVSELQRTKTKIVIPAPVLGEFLVIADKSGPDYLDKIDKTAVFKVEPYDAKAATEAATFTRQALHAGGHKKDGATGSWQCIKADRQIAAICKALGITRIYSNDHDMQAIGGKTGIEVLGVHQLAVPPSDAPLLAMIEKAQDEIDGTAEPSPTTHPHTASIRAIAYALSIGSVPPSTQSPADASPITPPPAPGHPVARPDAPATPPPDPSGSVQPPAPTKQ